MPSSLQACLVASHQPTRTSAGTSRRSGSLMLKVRGGGSSSGRHVLGSAPTGGMGYGTVLMLLELGDTCRPGGGSRHPGSNTEATSNNNSSNNGPQSRIYQYKLTAATQVCHQLNILRECMGSRQPTCLIAQPLPCLGGGGSVSSSA